MLSLTARFALLVLAASLSGAGALAQNSYQSDMSHLNIGRRNTSQNSTNNQYNQQNRNNTKATPTPTPTPTSRGKAAMTSPRSSTRGTSGTQTARPARPSSGAPSKSGAPGVTTTGQIKEVTKGLLESVRTRHVNYDADDMAKKPGVVILNARKYQPEESRLEREGAKTAQPESIARPL